MMGPLSICEKKWFLFIFFVSCSQFETVGTIYLLSMKLVESKQQISCYLQQNCLLLVPFEWTDGADFMFTWW